MKLLRRLLMLTIWIPAVLPAADFNGFVREFSRQTGAHQVYIPFFGLARFVVAVAHPAGTSDLKLAVFEHVDARPLEFVRTADSLASSAGWNRIVRVRNRNGEATNIYTLRDGKRLRMLIANLDNNDATFVELRIKPEELMKFVDEHDGKRRAKEQ
jgi:hypothetical protein